MPQKTTQPVPEDNNTGKPQRSPKFGHVFRAKLKELGSNPRQFSADIEYSYDNIRKVYNGEIFPGPRLIAIICDIFDLDKEEMTKMVQADKAVDKGWVQVLTGEDPLLTQVKQFWPVLSLPDRQEVVNLIKFKVKGR